MVIESGFEGSLTGPMCDWLELLSCLVTVA